MQMIVFSVFCQQDRKIRLRYRPGICERCNINIRAILLDENKKEVKQFSITNFPSEINLSESNVNSGSFSFVVSEPKGYKIYPIEQEFTSTTRWIDVKRVSDIYAQEFEYALSLKGKGEKRRSLDIFKGLLNNQFFENEEQRLRLIRVIAKIHFELKEYKELIQFYEESFSTIDFQQVFKVDQQEMYWKERFDYILKINDHNKLKTPRESFISSFEDNDKLFSVANWNEFVSQSSDFFSNKGKPIIGKTIDMQYEIVSDFFHTY